MDDYLGSERAAVFGVLFLVASLAIGVAYLAWFQ